jgi:nitrogen fixation/metabolism regulation signal transduction histidine kinase
MFARLVRPRSIERRLLLWLLIITLVPSLTVLAAASWVGREAARWIAVADSWSGVAETGRTLINHAQKDAGRDPQLAQAAEAHRQQLSSSLTQARRLEFVGQRMRAVLPWLFLGLAVVVAGIAVWAARRMSRSVSRPIRELVDWSALIARDEPLPEPSVRELREVKELQALRKALRKASTDIATARSRALEAERTRSWGEMARRVAHEMKNPLTPLRLASHRLNAIASERPELQEPISVIAEETARLEDLAARFAVLGRPAEGPRANIDITDLLQRLLATDVPNTVAATITSASDQPFVNADYNSLVQAFRNLVRNALEAMQHANGKRSIEVIISEDDEWLRVSVADTGRGIAPEAAERIFEPDFTSKPGGTGLGLAVARQTIRAHGGEITAHTRAAGGAEFVVRLPRVTNEDIVE